MVIITMQFILFILGMFFDPTGIVLLTATIFFPIVMSLGFDPMWFAILFVINMENAYLTPPYGINLFYMKAVVPPGAMLWELYKIERASCRETVCKYVYHARFAYTLNHKTNKPNI